MRYFRPKAVQEDDFEPVQKPNLWARVKSLHEKLTRPGNDDGLDDFEQYARSHTYIEPEIAVANRQLAHTEPSFESPEYGENTYNEYTETAAIEEQ